MREINLPALNAEQRQHAARILCEIGGTEWVTAIERVKKLPGTVYRSVDWERVERIGIALTQAGMTPEVRDSTLNATPLREQRFQAEESPARRDVNREAQMSVYKVTGVGEDLEVFEDKLTIGPRGVLGFMSKGLKGFPFVQLQPCSIGRQVQSSAGTSNSRFLAGSRVEGLCFQLRRTKIPSCIPAWIRTTWLKR